jgi:hypothetical protein
MGGDSRETICALHRRKDPGLDSGSRSLARDFERHARTVAHIDSMRLGKVAELVETAVHETLAYYTFSEEHWRRLRTNVSDVGRPLP